ncbi:hypothetical protein [Candidatus Protochlamydia phocaeensis]|uniref:hypothetical protein n=1 Tax=Candidatus Protochlamydia phocaeensis TaxID=1414722 RepID=UPI0008391160|nr:hypothetical protein [Candidatus Protochlamydia phocaeensis]
MNTNLFYTEFYNKVNNHLHAFSILDNFRINERRLLIEDADEIINYIAKGHVTPQQVQHLKALQGRVLKQAQGGKISNFFLTLFGQSKLLEDLSARTHSITSKAKKIDKLIKAKVGTDKLGVFLNGWMAKKLQKLVFEDHIYERMAHFGHLFTFNEKKEITFKFSNRLPLGQALPSHPTDAAADSYWNKLYEKFIEERVALEIRGEFDKGLYQTISPSEITVEQLKAIIIQEDGSFNKNVHVIYPVQELTVKELEDKGILNKDEKTGEYFINSEYQYLENGFTPYSEDKWEHLRPYAHTSTPPKDFTIDVVVHSRKGLPGIFAHQGHASIKMTTPQGEIFSVGFFPETEGTDRDPHDLSLQKGKFVSPDKQLFLPSSIYDHHILSYTLSDPKAFHQFIKWIEAMQGYHEDKATGEVNTSNVLYHPTHQSCAAFAAEAREYVIKKGAKSQLAQRKISNWTRFTIRIKELVANFLATNFLVNLLSHWDHGVEHAGIKNYNITHLNPKGFYLPIDLILDHET